MSVHRYDAVSRAWKTAYDVNDGTTSLMYVWQGSWKTVDQVLIGVQGVWKIIYDLHDPPPPPPRPPNVPPPPPQMPYEPVITPWQSGFRLLKNISPMMRGTDVKTVQSIVWKMYGHSVGWMGIDGIYGPYTAAGVKAFQKSKGLVQDSICGPKTWSKLFGVTV